MEELNKKKITGLLLVVIKKQTGNSVSFEPVSTLYNRQCIKGDRSGGYRTR